MSKEIHTMTPLKCRGGSLFMQMQSILNPKHFLTDFHWQQFDSSATQYDF